MRSLWMKMSSLRVRLTVAVAILSGAALTSGGVLLVRAVESTVLREVELSNRDQLEVVRRKIESGMPIEAVKVDAQAGFVRILRSAGAPPPWEAELRQGIMYRGGPHGLGLLSPPPPPPELLEEQGWSVLQLPLHSPIEGPLTAIAMRPLEDVRRSIETLSRVLFVGVPFLVLLTTLAAWILVGRALRPVHQMSQRAAGIADATSGDRLTVPPTYDEVAELARTLNTMLDRLAEGSRRQREFISDASHELRSPIASLRTLIEVSIAHPGRHDPFESLLSETLRLETLVGDLLVLARLDEGRSPARDEIDLDDLVHEEASRPRRTPIDTRGVEAVKICGDRRGFMHLVRNLLDNAARYAASRVAVTTRSDRESVLLFVDDDGPGIPEEDRARVFERFTRLESGRSRDTGGTGLGLALVHRIAEQHGGSARIDRSPEGGARLEVRLPRFWPAR